MRWYWDNRWNSYQTCKKIELNSKTMLWWIKDEGKIKSSKKGRKLVKFEQTSQYPVMEDTLYKKYCNHRQKGIKVKGWWFRTRAKQLLQAILGECQIKFLNGWFDGFKKHYKISLRCSTNKAQHVPSDKRELIRNFHRKIHQEAAVGPQIGKLGQFRSSSVANVDQTPLPFTFTNGPTYETKGAKTVWKLWPR